MRVVLSAVLALSVSLCGDAFGRSRCFYDENVLDVPAQTDGQSASTIQSHSSFRGIGLASRPEDVQRVVRSIGFYADTSYYVGSDTVAGINFYADWQQVGRADFDRLGRMSRLSLKDRFFCDAPIFVRRFADALFERYGVKPADVDDDVCFQDVTCFKGVSKHGEQFLILRIGTEAELYVRR